MMTTNAARILSKDEGQPFWYLGALMNIKLGSEHTGGKFSLIEELIPRGVPDISTLDKQTKHNSSIN
jgi:hypothetical protein